MTEQEIRVRLEATDSQEFLRTHGFSQEQSSETLRAYIAEKLKAISPDICNILESSGIAPYQITPLKVRKILGQIFFESPFPFNEGKDGGKPTEEGARQLINRLIREQRLNPRFRGFLFQTCIHLRFDWEQTRKLFEDVIALPFTNYGKMDEVIYEYSISRGYSIEQCYALYKAITEEYASFNGKAETLSEEIRSTLSRTELAKRQTIYINDRYAEDGVGDKDEEDFKMFMREQFPYFHSVRETALRDFKHLLYAPREILFKHRYLKFNKANDFILGIDQLKVASEEKEYNGQKYVSRYHYNTEIIMDRLVEALSRVQYFNEYDDEDGIGSESTLLNRIGFYDAKDGENHSLLTAALVFDKNSGNPKREVVDKLIGALDIKMEDAELFDVLRELKNLLGSEERREERIKYRKERIQEELVKILNGDKSISRELFLASVLLSGHNDIHTIENMLNPEGNGFEELNVTHEIDAMVYEAVVQTQEDETPLAAFLRLCDNVVLRESSAFKI
jgi:hypothetical protein